MPKNGVHFTVFIAKSESCEFYEVLGVQYMTGFLPVFVGGSLKFAMKFYRDVRGIVVSKSGYQCYGIQEVFEVFKVSVRNPVRLGGKHPSKNTEPTGPGSIGGIWWIKTGRIRKPRQRGRGYL